MAPRWIALATILCVTTSLVSVAVSGIFLGVAFVATAVELLRGRLRVPRPSFGLPLILFGICLAISICFSPDPWFSAKSIIKHGKLVLVFLVVINLTKEDVRLTYQLCLGVGIASASYALLQYLVLVDVNLLNRIRGFMSHWMTFSGQMMLILLALTAALFYLRLRGTPFVLVSTGLVLVSVALLWSLTRNAWIGGFLGVFVLLFLRFRRWRWLMPVALLLPVLALAGPMEIRDRLASAVDLTDETTRGRLELLQTGLRMVAAHPLAGVGPRLVSARSVEFRSDSDFPQELYVHLHNSPLQVAAEFGVPALLALAWLWWNLFRDNFRMARSSREPWLRFASATGSASLAAFLAAGFFEYNFGDSEVLTLLLFFATASYVLSRSENPA